MDNATDPMLGRVLDGRYRIDSRIARGGMAMVYLGRDLRLGRAVAIKVMHAGFADDETFVARFGREARSAAALAHPNVVAVFDQGEDHGTLFLVMEYVPGKTLRDLIREQAPLSPARALALMEPVLSALQAAHAAGLVHRDIKPENVLLGTDDPRQLQPSRMKVADFGLARAVSAETHHTTTGGVLIGTVSYLAPELLVDQKGDARADVYAAGVLLFELLTGTKPHQGESPIQVAYKHVHEDMPAPSTVVASIPPYVDALVARATARDTDIRPPDAGALLQHVRRVRQALDNNIADDPDLTSDLTPLRGAMAGTSVDDPTGPMPVLNGDTGELTGIERTSLIPTIESTRKPKKERAAKPRRRRRRGRWLLIFLMAFIAAAIASWFLFFTTVPGVTGLSQADAQTKLAKDGLHLKVDGSDYSETVPKGLVISESPHSGIPVINGSTIGVTLSLGPERYAVPNLVGKTQDQAAALLSNAHLQVGNTNQDYSDTVQQGSVISSDPAAGTSVKPRTSVNLLISKGPAPVAIPNVAGMPLDQATKTLTDLGLKVDSSQQAFSDTVAQGSVISQNPGPGTGHRMDTVTLIVSKGPQLVAVPDVTGMSWNDLTTTLRAAGLNPTPGNTKAQAAALFFPTSPGAKNTNPAKGTMVKPGSTVTVNF